MRRGDGEGRLFLHLDRVLLRHGHHRSELERSSVPSLETGDQFRLGMAPEKALVKGDDRTCSRLLGNSVELIGSIGEMATGGSHAGIQVRVMAGYL